MEHTYPPTHTGGGGGDLPLRKKPHVVRHPPSSVAAAGGPVGVAVEADAGVGLQLLPVQRGQDPHVVVGGTGLPSGIRHQLPDERLTTFVGQGPVTTP